MTTDCLDVIRGVPLFEVEIEGAEYRQYGEYYFRRVLTHSDNGQDSDNFCLFREGQADAIKNEIDECVTQWIASNLPATSRPSARRSAMYSLTEQLLAAQRYLSRAPEEDNPRRKTGRRPTTLEEKVRSYFKYEEAMKGKGWITATAFRDSVREHEGNPNFTLEGARHVLMNMLLPTGLVETKEGTVGKGHVRRIHLWRWVDKRGE